jgi:molecular chaperone GrpE (heat shock protein)
MNKATEDLESIHISNLNTIRELNTQVEQLESEKSILNNSNLDTIADLNNRLVQLESEKNSQNVSNLNTIRELSNRIDQLESEKSTQNIENLGTIKELSNQVEQLELEKSSQFTQTATGIITFVDSFEKLNKSISKKALNKTKKGEKILDRHKKVRKSLEALLSQFEITKVTFPDDQLIPGLYKVVGTEPDADSPNDTILSIVKDGYIRGTEVIREAEVIVVKNEGIQGDE